MDCTNIFQGFSPNFLSQDYFRREGAQLIHKLSKDFSEDPTAAIFGAQSCHQKIDREKVWGLLPVFRITIDITSDQDFDLSAFLGGAQSCSKVAFALAKASFWR